MGTAPQFFPGTTVAGHRTFGDDLAPPRPAYFTVYPAILILTGVVTWMLSDDAGFVLAAVAATVIGFLIFWGWLVGRGPTRLSTLLAMALLLGYGGGALNTWATLPRGGLTLSATFGLAEGVLARCLGIVLISSGLLLFFGEILEKPIFGRDFRLVIGTRMRMVIYVGTLAMIAGYLHHSMGIAGAATAAGHVSVLGYFLIWLYPSLTSLSVAALFTSRSGWERILSAITCLGLLGIFAFLGRRVAVYTSVEVLFVLGLCGYQLRKLSFRNILLLLGLGATIVVGSLTFMLLRIAAGSVRQGQQVSVGKRIDVARRMAQRGDAYKLAARATQANVQSRTFVLGFLANILDASLRKPTAMGVDVAEEFQGSIPSILYPGKNRFFSEEALVDQQFGFGFGDEANSILTAGATDFGWVGMILYPLLIIALCRLVYDFVAIFLREIPLLFVALALIYFMLQTETGVGGYFNAMRSTVAFGLLLSVVTALPAFRLSGRHEDFVRGSDAA